MKRYDLTFGECEHYGDLNNYDDELRAAGFKTKIVGVDTEQEEGYIIVQTELNITKFKEKIKEINCWDLIYGIKQLDDV